MHGIRKAKLAKTGIAELVKRRIIGSLAGVVGDGPGLVDAAHGWVGRVGRFDFGLSGFIRTRAPNSQQRKPR